MAGDDQNEIGVSAELTSTGFSAKLRSRAASAYDRLWGSRFDKKSVPIDAANAEARAVAAARVTLIEAIGDMGMQRLKDDPEFAARAVENFLPALLRRQDNKDAVLEVALEDLRQNPPSDADQAAGAERLDEPFIDRLERYAEDASTEELRAKWGKVLASEIRKPGTFSGKVLRVVDELDPKTALLFEELCKQRVHNVIIRCVGQEPSYVNKVALVSADLLVDPGLGQTRSWSEVTDGGGNELWVFHMETLSVGISKNTPLPAKPKGQEVSPVIMKGNGLATPVYILTDVGHAVSSILPDTREAVTAAFIDYLATWLAPHEVWEFRHIPDTGMMQVARIHSRPTPQAET